jgi:hypothetical protein
VQPVIALEVDEEAKAYPLAILTRHEIANDEIAGLLSGVLGRCCDVEYQLASQDSFCQLRRNLSAVHL